MCSNSEDWEDKRRIMIEELTEELHQLFPSDEKKISTSLLTMLYSTAKLNHAKLLVSTMNEIRNEELRSYLLNLVRKLNEWTGMLIIGG